MYIAIGKIIQTHGIRGQLKAIPYSGIAERFSDLKTVYIESDAGMIGFVLEKMHIIDNATLMKLSGVDSREQAQALLKKELWVPETQKVLLSENSFFIHDLIGLSVFDIHAQYIGKLEDVWQSAGNDIYVVRNDGKEVLIPAVSEFIETVDIAAGRMTVRLIEGMAD